MNKIRKMILFTILFLLSSYTNENSIVSYEYNNIDDGKDDVKDSTNTIDLISKNEFNNMSAKLESNCKYSIANKFGYVGKYQFGRIALKEIGYSDTMIDSIQNSICYTENSKGVKMYSFDTTLFNKDMQEKAICDYYHLIEFLYMKKDIEKYVGKDIGGVHITKAGIIGASILGFGHVHKFLNSNGKINHLDGNNTSIKSRLEYFQKVELSECF